MRRALVVEDYPPLATVISIALRRLGFDPVRVGSVQRGQLASGHFECAILDLELPDGDGVELATQLRREGRVGVVVFFSAARDIELLSRALAVGPVVDKPEGVEALMSVLEEELTVSQPRAVAVGDESSGDPPRGRSSGRSGTRRRVR